MDGFRVANDITQSFATWVEMPLRAAIIPYFTQTQQEHGEAEAWRRASNVLNTAALFLAGLSLVLFFGADLFARVFATGFADEPGAWDQTARLVHVMAWTLVFSVLAVLLGSLQNLYRRQLIPALGRVANGLAVLLGAVLLGPKLGIDGLALGVLAGPSRRSCSNSTSSGASAGTTGFASRLSRPRFATSWRSRFRSSSG
ncbi:MAG: hypothetical protein HC882_09610 [Acidobacteria bacterium]|nr:hypothetical protein [Acidobacteriota bacterium]